jgi:hypothetical protein
VEGKRAAAKGARVNPSTIAPAAGRWQAAGARALESANPRSAFSLLWQLQYFLS